MTAGPEPTELELDYAGLEPEAFKPVRTPAVISGALVVVIIVLAAVLVPLLEIDAKKTRLVAKIEEHERIVAAAHAEVISTWLQGTLRLANLILDSELFRLFGTEVAMVEGDFAEMVITGLDAGEAGPEAPLIKQLPLIERMLTDFANNAGLVAAYMFGPRGDPYAASAGSLPIGSEQKALAQRAFQDQQVTYGPIRQSPAGLEMDIFLPLLPAQAEIGQSDPVAVVLLTAPLGEALSEALAPSPLAAAGGRQLLLQRLGDRLVDVRPGGSPALQAVEIEGVVTADGGLPFGERDALRGDGKAYSVGVPVPGPGWIVMRERDLKAATQPLESYATAAWVVAALVVLVVVAVFGAFWWRLASTHDRFLAEQFRHFAARLQAQKRFLDSINNTIAEYIGLKSLDGTYRYANPALARAAGRNLESVIGLDDAALFGAGTAKRLQRSDQAVMASGEVVTDDEEVYLGSKLHHLQISKVPFRNDRDEIAGIVSVTRDVTEIVEQRRKKDLAIRQLVNALVRAIELRDPYLGGHSRRVRGFAAAVAKGMGASPEEITTLELAADLSQIGKLAIPREILTKPERLTEPEIRTVETHLDHAAAILKDIDFELPVLETIYQMHERLDGKGYPRGLKGEEISLTGRILGACDVFCARIEPRSYRPGISIEEALDILEKNQDRYDPRVIAVLREVSASVLGEKLIAGISSA